VPHSGRDLIDSGRPAQRWTEPGRRAAGTETQVGGEQLL